jgi:two-component system OmpR family sensor kinase
VIPIRSASSRTDVCSKPCAQKQFIAASSTIVDNALRATPDGGRVNLQLYAEGDAAVFRVDDAGPGIAAAELPRVFEPFYRGRGSKGEGTGLGLSIVDRIVKGASGTVMIENITAPAGPGLRVTVRLPRVGATAGGAEEAATADI